MKYEKVLEQESLNQRALHRKSARTNLRIFIGVAVVAVGFRMFTGSVPRFFYGGLIFIVPVIIELLKSAQPNEELWRKWEERWSGRRRLFLIKEALATTLFLLMVSWVLAGDYGITISTVIGGIVAQWGDTSKRWQAKNEYLEKFKEEVS